MNWWPRFRADNTAWGWAIFHFTAFKRLRYRAVDRIRTPGCRFPRVLARLLHPLADPVALQDDGVVHQPIDGGHCRHRVLENLIPLAEDQIRTD
jgi:hypothetical protein